MQAPANLPSLARHGAILAALLSALAALAIGFAFHTRPAAEAPPTAMQKNALASQIEFLAESARLQAQAVAAHPQTLACFEEGSDGACKRQAANLHALNAAATLDFVREGSSANLLPGFLPDTTRRLLERAARENGGAARSGLSLTVSQPVLNARNQRVGFVVLEQGMPQLQAMFDNLPLPVEGAYAELVQILDGQVSTLMRRGNQALKDGAPAAEAALAGTPWKIALWRSKPPLLPAALPYLFAWLLLTLAIAVLVLAMVDRMSGRVAANLRILARMINDMHLNRLQEDYPVSLDEFVRPAKYLLKAAHLQLGRERKVTTAATFDHLSKTHNRRSFEERQVALFKSLQDGWSHSLLVLDIDNFKQINDTFGHEAGDRMIAAFGKALRENLRSSDFIARLGGDEFCVLFPHTTLERARELTERLRTSMPNKVELVPGVIQKLSWSGGLSEYSKDDGQPNLALARADAALLEAKREGRNNTRIKAAA